MFDDKPDTPCDLIELDSSAKEQAGFNSIQSAFGQSSSLSRSPSSKTSPKSANLQAENDHNLIQFDSPRKSDKTDEESITDKGDVEEKVDTPCKLNGTCASVKESKSNENDKIDANDGADDEEPRVVVDANAKSLDSDMIGRVTAEMISPREFICPITTKIMKQPVRAPDGFIYEKRAISEWIERHGLSPISRTQMKVEDLQTADDVSAKIKEWRKKRKLQRQKMESQLHKAKEAGGNNADIIC